MLIVVERRETFHYYYPMGVHPPGDLTVTQDDLINYVEQQMKSHSAESKRDDQETDLKKIRKDIQDNFQVLLIRYKEV